MKMSKEDRDAYVWEHRDKTRAALVSATGWSLTTIKSVRKRLGIGVLTDRDIEIGDYILDNPDMCNEDIAATLLCKVDKVRDTKTRLGVPINTRRVVRKSVASYVYLIHIRDDLYKFGKSDNPVGRLHKLQKQSVEYEGASLVLMVRSNDAFKLEREVLNSSVKFVNTDKFVGSTEWVTGDLVTLIDRLVELSLVV